MCNEDEDRREISKVTAKFYKLGVRCNAPDVHSTPRASSSFFEKSELREKKKYDIKKER